MSEITVTKAYFKITSGPNQGQQFDVHFNPASLEYQIVNRLDSDRNNPRRQFVSSSTAKLTMELYFDTTYTSSTEDVRTHTVKIARMLRPMPQGQRRNSRQVPPVVEFWWGTYSFKGIVEQFKETLDFFAPNGMPLRSKINLTLSTQDVVFAAQGQDAQGPSNEAVEVPGAQSTTGVATNAGDPTAGRLLALANALESMRFPDGPVSVPSDIPLGPPTAFASAGAAVGASAALGASAGISAGIGLSAGASLGASAGISAGASAGFGASAGAAFGAAAGASAGLGASASAGFGAGASASFGAGAGASAGFSAGAGAGFSAGAAAGFGTSTRVSAGFGASAGAGFAAGGGAGFSAGAAARFGASAGSSFKASAGGSYAAAAYFTPTFGSSASAHIPATFGAFAGLHTQVTQQSVQLNTSGLLQTKTESYSYGSSATYNVAGQVDVRASGSADVQFSASAQARIRFRGG
ncbi:MAG: hypothetical protein K8L91_09175 [Anaerolineae bacterium]|nr:hypothetical protein [Anaerolineae bacterium]